MIIWPPECPWEDHLNWSPQWGAHLSYTSNPIQSKGATPEPAQGSSAQWPAYQRIHREEEVEEEEMQLHLSPSWSKSPLWQSPGSCRRRVFNLNVKQNPVPTVRGSVHWGETCHLRALPLPGNEFMCSVLKLIYTPPFSLFPQTAMKSVILTQNEHPHRHDDLWQIMQLVSSVWCKITGDVNKQSAK